jgi:hypothetical protein
VKWGSLGLHGAMRRDMRRHQQYTIQRERAPGRGRGCHVTHVYGVERAAEHAEARH